MLTLFLRQAALVVLQQERAVARDWLGVGHARLSALCSECAAACSSVCSGAAASKQHQAPSAAEGE